LEKFKSDLLPVCADCRGGAPRIFIGGTTEGPKPGSGWGSWGGESNPLPTSYGVWGIAVISPAGFRAELRPPKGFPLFSGLRMASSDTIILLIVDYHAAVGGKTPVSP